MFGINSYATNTFPQPPATSDVRQILSFQVDGDITPPRISTVLAKPNSLWPPNQKMAPVVISAAATDACGIASEKIVSVTSNEPSDGTDWEITGNLSLLLRADRNGSGNGRVYTITVEVTDPSGNKAQQTVAVTVPHDQR